MKNKITRFYRILKLTAAVVMDTQHDFVVYKLVEMAIDKTAEWEREKQV